MIVGVTFVIVLVVLLVMLASFLFKRMLPILLCTLMFVSVFHLFVMPISDVMTYGKIVKNSYVGSEEFKINIKKRTIAIKKDGYRLNVDASERFKFDGRVRSDKISDMSSGIRNIVYASNLFGSVDKNMIEQDPMIRKLLSSDYSSALSALHKADYSNGSLRIYSKDGFVYIKNN